MHDFRPKLKRRAFSIRVILLMRVDASPMMSLPNEIGCGVAVFMSTTCRNNKRSPIENVTATSNDFPSHYVGPTMPQPSLSRVAIRKSSRHRIVSLKHVRVVADAAHNRRNEIWYRKIHKDKIERRALFFVGTIFICVFIGERALFAGIFLFFAVGGCRFFDSALLAVSLKPPEIAIVFVLLTALK